MSTSQLGTLPKPSQSSAATTQFLQLTVQRLMPGWRFGGEDFRYLQGGYANANYSFRYQGQSYVLRTPVQTREPQAPSDVGGLAAEVQFRALLEPQDSLAIAPMVAADVTSGQMITRLVEGPLLAEESSSATSAITYMRHLHQRLLELPQTRHYNLAQRINQWLPEPPAWLSAYLNDGDDLQRLAQGPLQCCHNDLNPWNIIVSSELPQLWTTLDWETATLAHPVFDAVTLHQGMLNVLTTTSSTDAHAPTWPSLDAFCAEVLTAPVSASLLLAALRCYWLREYAWAADQVRQGNLNQAIAQQQQQAQEQLRGHL